jgi:hypothetical protein
MKRLHAQTMADNSNQIVQKKKELSVLQAQIKDDLEE